MPELVSALTDTLAGAGGDPMIAARTTLMQQAWSIAEPETRAGLVSLAWRARSAAPLPAVGSLNQRSHQRTQGRHPT